MLLPRLPPAALQWSYAASTAAAISYADRGTSAIAASSILNELDWSESELGNVQSSFFIGYGLTQIIGGILGGEDNNSDGTTKSVVIELYFQFHFYLLELSQCCFHWLQVMEECHLHQLIDFVWAYYKDCYCQRPWLVLVTQQQKYQQMTIHRKTIISRQLPHP